MHPQLFSFSLPSAQSVGRAGNVLSGAFVREPRDHCAGPGFRCHLGFDIVQVEEGGTFTLSLLHI